MKTYTLKDKAESVDSKIVNLPADTIQELIDLGLLISSKMGILKYDPSGKVADVFDMSNMEEGDVSKIFTLVERNKLAGLESSKWLGQYTSLTSLELAYPSPAAGSYAFVDTGTGSEIVTYVWDTSDNDYVLQLGESTEETATSVKVKYESNEDTNVFSDEEKEKLSLLNRTSLESLAGVPKISATDNGATVSGTVTQTNAAVNPTDLVRKAEHDASLILTSNILVKLSDNKSVGKYVNGDTVPCVGKTFQEVLLDIATESIDPAATFSVTPSSTYEVGDIIDYTLDPGYTKNDAGDLDSIAFSRSNVLLTTQTTTDNYIDENRAVVLGTVSYQMLLGYESGATIPSGTISKSDSVIGAYRHWYSSVETLPTTGQQIRDWGTGSSSFSNTFNLMTGTTNKIMVIAVPYTKSLVSVIDLDAFSTDVTDDYVEYSTITKINDAIGVPVSYKVYVMNNASAYPTDNRHQVTLTNS